METIAIEDLIIDVILGFCENAAELGCPKEEKEVDMWFRNLSPEGMLKVADKLIEIELRDAERFKDEKGENDES